MGGSSGPQGQVTSSALLSFFPPEKKIDCRAASEIHLRDLIRLGNGLSVR
jgi:hypothetical protein